MPKNESEQTFEDRIIAQAREILDRRMNKSPKLEGVDDLYNYLTLMIGQESRECFGCVLLNARNMVIDIDIVFRGTVDRTTVYTREIVKLCLLKDAVGVILFHNHPSGICEPSEHDQYVTHSYERVFDVLDIALLDHVVIGGGNRTSFAERGLVSSHLIKNKARRV